MTDLQILNNESQSQILEKKDLDSNSISMDFVLKILKVKGKKIRVQLWDITGTQDPSTAFTPLCIRNAVGCIIVSKSDEPDIIKESLQWKYNFDLRTQIPGQLPFPSAIFINKFCQDTHFSEISTQQDTLQFEQKFTYSQNYMIDLFTINAESGQGIEEGFKNLMEIVVEDQLINRISYDVLIEQNWDESIKIKCNRVTKRLPKLSVRKESNNDTSSDNESIHDIIPQPKKGEQNLNSIQQTLEQNPQQSKQQNYITPNNYNINYQATQQSINTRTLSLKQSFHTKNKNKQQAKKCKC
ncbi:ras-related protein rab-32 [Stylonychia lemnae]|uniref:Ras-related protein rab-32 n=1 Tax=Stylonychia lemnae TaxID=5949 RepID=A0A078B3W9_STYLE|nr:ras-related protein rab-32 [Stylonychia lemnae]|eukprot:CDW89189.1 ras-related protein rab-32 [Stylonychia lemnae]